MVNSLYSKVVFVILGILPLLSPTSSGFIKSSPEHLKMAIGLPLIALLLFVGFFQGNKPSYLLFLKEKLSLTLVLFLFWCLITISWATNQYESFRVVLPWMCAGFAYFILARSLAWTRNLDTFLKIMLISGFSAATIGVFQYLFDFGLFPQVEIPASTFGNKNMGAEYVVLTIPLAFYFFFKEKKKGTEYLYLAMLSNMLLYVIYVRSRSAYLSVAIQAVFFGLFCLFEYKKNHENVIFDKAKLFKLVGLSFYLLIAMNFNSSGFKWGFSEYFDRVASVSEQTSLDMSKGNSRIPYWVNSLEMLKDYPLGGVGVGNWSIEYPKYYDMVLPDNDLDNGVKFDQLHNDFLEIFVSTGIIGGLLFLSFIFFFFRESYLLIFRKLEFKQKNAVLFMALGFLGFCVFANFNYPLQVFVSMMVICSYAAAVIALKIDSKSVIGAEKKVPVFSPEKYLVSKKILSFGLFLFVSVLMYRFILGEHYYNEAKAGESISQPEQRVMAGLLLRDSGQKSLDYNPYSWRTAFLVAIGHFFLNKPEIAYEILEKQLKSNPNNAELLNNLGIYAHTIGKFQEAVDYWERAIYKHSDQAYVSRMKTVIAELKVLIGER